MWRLFVGIGSALCRKPDTFDTFSSSQMERCYSVKVRGKAEHDVAPFACAAKGKAPELVPGGSDPLVLSDTDYSDMAHWLSFGVDGSYDVDAFLVYPTVTNSTDGEDLPYVTIDCELMLEKATAWLAQTGDLVSESANIYAPLYRQINAALLPELAREDLSTMARVTPREDVFAAFDYYLREVNKGERPFILMGHSQGADLVMELATTFLGNAAYYEYNKNHIITYAIGMGVVESEIAKNSNLKFSESKDDAGVIVSWNTIAPSEIANGAYKDFGTWKEGALTTNPLSWEAGKR